jgi:hypothetical protein
VRQAFAEVSLALEASGSNDNADERGSAAWQAFDDRIRRLEPPTSLVEEHQALIMSIDRLRTDASQDGMILAEAVTAACVELVASAQRLGVDEEIAC